MLKVKFRNTTNEDTFKDAISGPKRDGGVLQNFFGRLQHFNGAMTQESRNHIVETMAIFTALTSVSTSVPKRQ